MPRTKRPVKKAEKITEQDDALKKLYQLAAEEKSKIERIGEMEIRNINLSFKILMESIPTTYLQKTVGQLKTELSIREDAVAHTSATTRSSRATSHDDAVPQSMSRSTRRSRSADASCRKPPSTSSKALSQRRRSKSVYRTPALNKIASYNYPAITPKVTPNAAMTLVRQPRQGEMVVSMSGSPVALPAGCTMQPNQEERASCSILLQDGTMLSLQPKQLRHSQAYIPFSLMDSKVISQLKTLKDNLDKVVKLGEKAFKG